MTIASLPLYSCARHALLTASFIVLGGCAVGPDYKTPAAPDVAGYTEGAFALETASAKTGQGGVQRFMPGGDVAGAWWNLFQSESLSKLMETAIKNNPTLEASRAALRAAQETAAASTGAFFPSIDGAASDSRSKAASRTGVVTDPYTLYSASVSVSYAPDIFGATRRAVESAEAQAEAARFEQEAAYLTLTSNVATTAIAEASLRAQLDAAKAIVESQRKQLGIMKAQLDAGAIARPAYLAQTAAVAASETMLAPFEKELAQTRHRMATLLGRFPSEGVPASFTMEGLTLPEELPVSLPSNLVKQRPDIRAAEANLKAANAKIGIAMAAMLPQFSLTGSYGISAGQIANMFTPGTALWGLAAGIAQPLFQGGELLHKKRAAQAQYEQAAATYRATVLNAFRDVADTLRALEADAATLKAQVDAERAAAESLEMTTQQYNAGAVSYVALLSAQAAYQTAKTGLIKAKAARLADTAALMQALGGGWWNRKGEGRASP